MVRIVIDDFKHIAGANCQLSSLRKVLAYYNIEISEPMILFLHEKNAVSHGFRFGSEKDRGF